ncbi:MAG TPA: mandelate racemase/muconate lactonizing enzyme family protein [Hyphomicrobiaceae bacterium]|nr:mandelate racemase/muconate lactonizing enzyme family protein [Hyphomicrobiaceae bacterium]
MAAPRLEAVDIFYLSMPVVEDIGDGSQDACVVRVRAGGYEGWGECEASPLPTIAALVAPMSHSACHPVASAVLGEVIESPDDIRRINRQVRAKCLDLLQAAHTLSGIDMALWDLVGRMRDEPVWKLLGYTRAYPKLPYASVLFGDTAAETLAKARAIAGKGFRAAKFGWGPYGAGTPDADRDHVMAAREGLGPDAALLVDAGTIWVDDVARARKSLPALQDARATWLEEPFVSGALGAYAALARESGSVRLAGGEGAHDPWMARQMIDHGGIGFVQIDAGRVGGLSDAKIVADHARAKGVTYVNHTFTSQLALAASIHPFAGIEDDRIAEFPLEARPVAGAIAVERIEVGPDGLIRLPERPGIGMTVDPRRFKPYLVDTEIKVGGRLLYRTPAV